MKELENKKVNTTWIERKKGKKCIRRKNMTYGQRERNQLKWKDKSW